MNVVGYMSGYLEERGSMSSSRIHKCISGCLFSSHRASHLFDFGTVVEDRGLAPVPLGKLRLAQDKGKSSTPCQ